MQEPMIATCVRLAGPSAGIFLYRLNFWSSTRRVIWHGDHNWVVMTLDEWGLQTGFTLKQLRTAREHLIRLGLIHAETHLFGNHTRMFARLTNKARQLLATQVADAQTGISGSAQMGISGSAQTGTTIYNGVEDGSGSMENSEHSLADKNGEKEMVSAKDVEAMIKARKHLHKPNSTSELEYAWKARVAELTNSMVVLKAKELGQLKHFANACPPGEALPVLKAVLADWTGFAKYAETYSGVTKSPVYPVTGFLLTHVNAALAFVAKTAQEEPFGKPPLHADALPVVSAPSKEVPVQVSPDHDQPASLEELLSILNSK